MALEKPGGLKMNPKPEQKITPAAFLSGRDGTPGTPVKDAAAPPAPARINADRRRQGRDGRNAAGFAYPWIDRRPRAIGFSLRRSVDRRPG